MADALAGWMESMLREDDAGGGSRYLNAALTVFITWLKLPELLSDFLLSQVLKIKNLPQLLRVHCYICVCSVVQNEAEK